MFGTRFCFYPGMAAAWIISAEPFLAGSRVVEPLKLRASWGLTGNDDIGNYTAQKYYVAKNLLGYQGTMMGNLWNPALGAERNSRINAGSTCRSSGKGFPLQSTSSGTKPPACSTT